MATQKPQELHELLLKTEPRFRYRGGDVQKWQQGAREHLAALLSLDAIPSCDPELFIEWEHNEADYHEYRFTLQTEPGYRVAGHLLVPANIERPPVMICLQGHSNGMHVSLGRPHSEEDAEDIAGDRDYALQALKEGYASLALEQRAFGECGGTEKGPACLLPASTAILLGRSLIGERVLDVMRTIDLLETGVFPVDSANVSITGNSGGGTTCIYAAAVDTRIKACMPSCAFCGYLPSIGVQQHCMCNYIPGIARDFDMGDLAALIAPRAFVAINGKLDPSFPIESAKEQLLIAKTAYEALNCTDKCLLEEGPAGHRYYAAIAWPALKKALSC